MAPAMNFIIQISGWNADESHYSPPYNKCLARTLKMAIMNLLRHVILLQGEGYTTPCMYAYKAYSAHAYTFVKTQQLQN